MFANLRRFASCASLAVLVTVAVSAPTSATASSLPTPAPGTAVSAWSGATEHSPSGAACGDYMFRVSLAEGAAVDQKVFGRFCTDGPPADKPLQILVHGGSYNHQYWDFPFKPETYSYVRSATEDGNATLALDLPGYGYSSHPPGTLLTFDTHAWAVHQIVQQIRQGALGTNFKNVLLVGHSMGSLISWFEAGRYHDVDGLISTGAQHTVNATTVATKVMTMLTQPAMLDPKFAGKGLIDYTTSYPGIRKDAFYHQPGADPGIYEVDERTKDTIPLGQWTTMLLPLQNTALTKTIDVPVLIVDGEHDTFYCTTECSATGSAAQEEPKNFNASKCLELYVLPEAGHDVNLQRTAPRWHAKASEWMSRCGLA